MSKRYSVSVAKGKKNRAKTTRMEFYGIELIPNDSIEDFEFKLLRSI